MNIDPTKKPYTDLRLESPVKRQRAGSESSGEESVDDQIEHSDLLSKLADADEIRPDVVELGRKLANDPSYPSDEVLNQLAEMLVDEFDDFDAV